MMSHFASYNTSDTNTGNTALAANASITVMALSAATEGSIVGMVVSDQAGVLTIEQSFDNQNWDIQNTINVTAATGAGMGIEVSQSVFAPYVQVTYANGGQNQTYLRIFLRAVGVRTS
jgi:hypothetical protein